MREGVRPARDIGPHLASVAPLVATVGESCPISNATRHHNWLQMSGGALGPRRHAEGAPGHVSQQTSAATDPAGLGTIPARPADGDILTGAQCCSSLRASPQKCEVSQHKRFYLLFALALFNDDSASL